MDTELNISQDIIFVDCFNTIIFRKNSSRKIFARWAEKLSKEFKLSSKQVLKFYKRAEVLLCVKKIIRERTLIEKFEKVIEKVFDLLVKKYPNLEKNEFINFAENVYIEVEADNHYVKADFINYLTQLKSSGKTLYVVSDFYCSSEVLLIWLKKLGLDHLFSAIYSSCDFDKEKATGKIYKHLIKKLNLNPENIIMMGDNFWSDCFMARQNHLNALNIKRRF